MKQVLCLVLFLLPTCALATDDPCASLSNTAIGAALDDPTDTYNLAVDFYTGKCVKKNYESAAKLWEKAASTGVLSAKNNLAYLLSEGLGVKQDESRAAALWLEAARAGHAESQVHLGIALFYGNGVPVDQAMGLAWVLQAADSALRNPDVGGGQEVAEMAQDEKSKMVGIAPDIIKLAKERTEQLGLSQHER